MPDALRGCWLPDCRIHLMYSWFKFAGLSAVLAGLVASSPAAGTVEPAAALFGKHWAACHGKDGKARNLSARLLSVKGLSVSTIAEAGIVKQITEGWKDPKGKQKMPPFNTKLSAEEIQSLVPIVMGFRK